MIQDKKEPSSFCSQSLSGDHRVEKPTSLHWVTPIRLPQESALDPWSVSKFGLSNSSVYFPQIYLRVI